MCDFFLVLSCVRFLGLQVWWVGREVGWLAGKDVELVKRCSSTA